MWALLVDELFWYSLTSEAPFLVFHILVDSRKQENCHMSKNKSDAHVKLGPKTKHKKSGYERK